MHDNAKVVSIHGNGNALVLPLIKDACINCANSGCAKRGTPFTAANPRSFSLQPGMTVRIAAKKSNQAFQALTSLCIPLVCAVGGWFLADTLAFRFGIVPAEGLHAAGVLAGLFIPSILILFITRHRRPAYGEIIEIVEK